MRIEFDSFLEVGQLTFHFLKCAVVAFAHHLHLVGRLIFAVLEKVVAFGAVIGLAISCAFAAEYEDYGDAHDVWWSC